MNSTPGSPGTIDALITPGACALIAASSWLAMLVLTATQSVGGFTNADVSISRSTRVSGISQDTSGASKPGSTPPTMRILTGSGPPNCPMLQLHEIVSVAPLIAVPMVGVGVGDGPGSVLVRVTVGEAVSVGVAVGGGSIPGKIPSALGPPNAATWSGSSTQPRIAMLFT
ncbi:MAG: hypothetical protein DIKNOCCD_02052 [bacterium]|nr:hypothetical protein [bacterium]